MVLQGSAEQAGEPFFSKSAEKKGKLIRASALQFIDVDGKECGPRWVLVDPKGVKAGEEPESERSGCVVM